MPAPSLKESWHLAMFFGGSGLKVALSLVLWIAGLMAVIRARRNSAIDDYWRGMLLVLWAVVPAVLLALISLRQPMFLQRYVFFSLPAACILAAIGAGMLSRWRLGFVLVLALCIADVPSVVKSYSHPREDWRGASRLVLSSASPGDAVAFFPFYTRVMLDYYASQTAARPMYTSSRPPTTTAAKTCGICCTRWMRTHARFSMCGSSWPITVRSWRISTTALRPRQSWNVYMASRRCIGSRMLMCWSMGSTARG